MISRIRTQLGWAILIAILFAGIEGAGDAHAHVGDGDAPAHAATPGGDGDADAPCEPCAHGGAHVLGPVTASSGGGAPACSPVPAGRVGLLPGPRHPPPLRPPNSMV